MAWSIEIDKAVKKDLKGIDPQQVRQIMAYLHERVAPAPRRLGKSLKGNSAGLWRYRLGDYRIVCELRDGVMIVLVVRIGHRKEVHDR